MKSEYETKQKTQERYVDRRNYFQVNKPPTNVLKYLINLKASSTFLA